LVKEGFRHNKKALSTVFLNKMSKTHFDRVVLLCKKINFYVKFALFRKILAILYTMGYNNVEALSPIKGLHRTYELT
jgi:hypothetical protein